ncbi:MAG TPA: GNAT family protein [Chloroflexia bacterium]|nr:GNAT family protein [Chloroflexia bacterium]
MKLDEVVDVDAETPRDVPAERLLLLRDGRHVVLRAARLSDAHLMLSALNEVASEGRFLLRRAWEITDDLEQRWIRTALADQDLVVVAMLLENAETRAEIDVAGSLSLVRGRPEFIRHTADLGMWLRAAFREQGLGSAMLEYVLNWAAAQGDIEKINLSARSTNRRALNLYRKYGFREEGRRRRHIKTEQGYEDEVLLGCFVHGPFTPEASAADPMAESDEPDGNVANDAS